MPRLDDRDVEQRSSHWLHQALAEDRDLAPPLEGRVTCDVCIIGSGYMGLWTAIRLKDARPELDVVILERDICGGGVSGRNSGMVLSAWTKHAALTALGGPEAAQTVIDASTAVISEIELFCKAEMIDAWFERTGWIWGATCAAQNGAWRDALARSRAAAAPAREIGRDEIRALTGSAAMIGGAFDKTAATIHPGFLVRGLRAAALRRGVRIYERTRMNSFTRKGEPVVRTPKGEVRCGHLVLAVNAWSAGIAELAPAIFNISSDDAASLPMPEILEQAGYRHGPLMSDSRIFVTGWRTTRDGRLNVGVTGGFIGFGGTVGGRFDAPSPRVGDMRAALRAGHPALANFPLERAWNGAIDRTATGLPLFGRFAGNDRILYGYGFSGNGIGMTSLGGRIIANLILGRHDVLHDTPLLRAVTRGFPREPFRFVGAHLVRGAVRQLDRAEHQGRRAHYITRRLAGLAPSGVTPSNANIAGS
ncbi:NAD(P)/FAD-dependent oxidoreductase [Aestuariivirga sp.]|uniref:NAD(P)/FAD-dependent oxidoreductase n=1 Tax=Aestuariivirga sp. TaxID=2650926 RepID=UPI003BAA374F